MLPLESSTPPLGVSQVEGIVKLVPQWASMLYLSSQLFFVIQVFFMTPRSEYFGTRHADFHLVDFHLLISIAMEA